MFLWRLLHQYRYHSMREECQQFKGRFRDLCEGQGLSGRPSPPQHAVDRFRDSHGLERIEVIQVTPSVRFSPHRQQKSRIGDRLAKMFASEWGAVPCGECKRAITRLNRMTVEEVVEHRKELIKDIASRASTSLPQYWARILTAADQFVHLGGTEYVIGRYLDQACEQELADAK